METWANPIPVAVTLLPVSVGARTGLLVVRRAIPPVGALALVGGFVEAHESWQLGAARELREEANVTVDPASLEPFWVASSAPVPNRILLFTLAPKLTVDQLGPFHPNTEASHRGVIFGPGEADDALAFSLHTAAALRYFAAPGRLDFVEL